MADTVQVHWIYPPEWNVEEVADDKNGYKRICVRFTNISDGTGETDVRKVDISKLRTSNGSVVKRTVVERIDWQVYGMDVKLEWDRAPNALITHIGMGAGQSNGSADWKNVGGLIDPGLDDGTGDILVTTIDHTAKDSYDITLWIRLKDS